MYRFTAPVQHADITSPYQEILTLVVESIHASELIRSQIIVTLSAPIEVDLRYGLNQYLNRIQDYVDYMENFLI